MEASFLDLNIREKIQALVDIVRNRSRELDSAARDAAAAYALQLAYGPCLDIVQCAAFGTEQGDAFRSRIAKWTELGAMNKKEAMERLIELLDAGLPGWKEQVVSDYLTKLNSPRAKSIEKSRGSDKSPQSKSGFSLSTLESILGSYTNSPEGKAKQFREKLVGSIIKTAAKIKASAKLHKLKSPKQKDLTKTKTELLELRASQRRILKDLKAQMTANKSGTSESLALSLGESSKLIGRLFTTVGITDHPTPSLLYIRQIKDDLLGKLEQLKTELIEEAEAYKRSLAERISLEKQLRELKQGMKYLKEMNDPVIQIFKLSKVSGNEMLEAIRQVGLRFSGMPALCEILENRKLMSKSQEELLLTKEAECNAKRQILSEAQIEEYKHIDRFAKQLKGQMSESTEADVGNAVQATDLMDKIEERRQTRLSLLSELQRKHEVLSLVTERQGL